MVILTSLAPRTTAGILYVAESSSALNSDAILKFAPDGSRTTLAAGLSVARGLAFDASGQLFAVNSGPGTILRIEADGTKVPFVTGEGSTNLVDLSFQSGNLFITKFTFQTGSVAKFTPSGTRSVFASSLNFPSGLAFDSVGNLFVSEDGQRILKLTPGGAQTVFASGLQTPTGLAFDGAGNLFVAEQTSGRILRITPSGVQSTFATVVQPIDLTFDEDGNLFVSDYNGGFLNDGGFVYKFLPDGTRITFASGLDPTFLTFAPVPELTGFAFGAVCVLAVAVGKKIRLRPRPLRPLE
jgi:hypothetical protein